MNDATMKKVGIGLVAGGLCLSVGFLVLELDGLLRQFGNFEDVLVSLLALGLLLPAAGTFIYQRTSGAPWWQIALGIVVAAVPLAGPPVILVYVGLRELGLPILWIAAASPSQEAKIAGQGPELNHRRTDGRQLPYRILRVLARVYLVLAPLILGTMLLIGLILLMVDGPVPTRVGTFVGMSLIGGMYYLLMKSASQAIYLMFDVASSTSLIRELQDAMKLQAREQEKLAISLRELSELVKGGGQGNSRASA